MRPDLWLGLPVGDLESDTAAFSCSSRLNISEILSCNIGRVVLHVHLAILEEDIKLSPIVLRISLNHSVKT